MRMPRLKPTGTTDTVRPLPVHIYHTIYHRHSMAAATTAHPGGGSQRPGAASAASVSSRHRRTSSSPTTLMEVSLMEASLTEAACQHRQVVSMVKLPRPPWWRRSALPWPVGADSLGFWRSLQAQSLSRLFETRSSAALGP